MVKSPDTSAGSVGGLWDQHADPAGADRRGPDGQKTRAYVAADSLGYLSLDGMVEAAGGDKSSFCRACFNREYPVQNPEGAGKFVLEDRLQLPTG